jgi:hypothetical protein
MCLPRPRPNGRDPHFRGISRRKHVAAGEYLPERLGSPCHGRSASAAPPGVVLIIAMRRISAILLVALFSFSLISPALFAQVAGSELPTCCRRAGKHHCAMAAIQSESSSGPVLQTGRCPFFPVGQAVPANRTVSLAAASASIFAGLVGHPACCPQTEALCRISYSRAGQKRGPPTPLS